MHKIGLGPACGLLRRPTRPSTPCADFISAVSQHDDLNLFTDKFDVVNVVMNVLKLRDMLIRGLVAHEDTVGSI